MSMTLDLPLLELPPLEADPTPVLESVRALAPRLRARADEIEAARRIPLDVAAELRAAGVFRMFVPRTHGGLEVTLPSSLRVIEELARADGSVGWVSMIGCETPHVLAKLPRERFDALYGEGPDVLVCGAFGPQGRAVPVDGGYRVSGRWAVVSGCQHSDWVFGTCVVEDPAHGGQAPPRLRSALFRPEQLQVHDTWFTLGLRGTGSHDVTPVGTFVPEDLTFDLLEGPPSVPGQAFVLPVFQFSCHMAAVALGIAQGALDEVTAQVLAGRRRRYTRVAQVDSPVLHDRLGRAEADLRAARAVLHAAAAEQWVAAGVGVEAAGAAAARVSATVAWVAATAGRVVDACFAAGGTAAARDGSPLQRRFRDVHTALQHTVLSDGWFETAGAAALGRGGPLLGAF